MDFMISWMRRSGGVFSRGKKRVPWKKTQKTSTSWWLNHPSEKYESKWVHLPQIEVEMKNSFQAKHTKLSATLCIKGIILDPNPPVLQISDAQILN